MANSSGLNERPSRTSLRSVATLYQGSIPILLWSLHACEQIGRGLLQAPEVRIGQRLETAVRSVHPVPDAVGNDHIARKPKRCHVTLGLLECPLHARAQTLGFDHQVRVLR